MPFKKGQSGNPEGRPVGAKNKAPIEVKNAIAAALEGKKDLISKAKYYASHPDERKAIAKAGQELVHEKHKWTDRMQFVINTLKGWN